MITAIIFIIVLGVLVFVHEAGHFFMAKKSGMKVEEFGFGFPPRIWGVKKGETTYSMNWIPFGGFVKILGEDGADTSPRSFNSKGTLTRSLVIIAGVVMNVVLAMVLLAIVNTSGLRVGLVDDSIDARDIQVQILQVAKDGPASQADIRLLDSIVALKSGSDELEVNRIDDIQKFINEHRGSEVTFTIQRGNQLLEKTVEARIDPPPGEGSTGITLVKTGLVSYPWYESIWRGVYDGGRLTYATAFGYGTIIKNLIVDGDAGVEISGPIGIAVLTGQASQSGINYLLQFVALISINLAIINIIPFPALDGGRLLFIIIERIKGSPVNKKIEGMVNAAGFALLIILMLYITTKDVLKFF